MLQYRFFLELLFILLNMEFSFGNSTIDCNQQSNSCLLCKPSGCVKCATLIIYPTRECVTECPSGYGVRWSTLVDYMGKMCVHHGYLGGLSGETAAIVVGICSGAVICLVIISIAIFYVRYKRKHPSAIPSETPSDAEDSPERRDFLKQIETLRPHAPTFLDMLNDTRRQIRELHGAGDNTAITAYKPVVRDLAKILLLLNRPTDKLAVIPEDWDHLFSWAEKTLKRYKRMSEISQPQVAQLVSFLQTPMQKQQQQQKHQQHRNFDENNSPTYSQTLSTFKPDQQFGGSALSLQDIAVKNFNSNYDNNFTSNVLNPQWNFNYSLVNTTTNNSVTNNPTGCTVDTWQDNNTATRDYLNSSYLLEDDFFQFGFRPQDEITTEL